MRKGAFLIILCLIVALGLWPAPAFAQRGGGGHGGGGFGGGGFGGGGFHGGGFGGGGFHGSVGGAYHGGGYSGGYRGGAYSGGRGYYGGRGYGYGWRGGYSGYGWRGRYWGYPGWGWGWGYPYWGFGLGWGWPYWWGYPYGYAYGYPYSYYYNSPDSSDCTPGYNCPDNNGSDDPPPNPNLGPPLYQGPDYRGPQNAPENPSRPPATPAPQTYAPSAPRNAPGDDSGAPIVSVDHIMATPSSYHVVHTRLTNTHLSPQMQNAVQHLENMPPFAREREIDTGRYSHFTPAEKQILRSLE